MAAVDPAVLVPLVSRDDASQVAAAEAFVAAGAWVPDLALAEAMRVLESVYAMKPAQIACAVEMILDHKDLPLQVADARDAAPRQFRKRPAPGFSDRLTLESAHKPRYLPLGTFDRRLGRLEGAQRL